MQLMKIDYGLIDPDPDQPRKEFDTPEDAALEASLKTHGQWTPLLVYKSGPRYVIVDGERRYRAAGKIGHRELQACVLDGPPKEADRLLAQLVITCQRKDFNALEKALAFSKLKAAKALNNKQLAELLSLSPSMVTQLLSLLEQEPEVQQRVASGELSLTAAYALRQEKDPQKRSELAAQAANQRLSRSAIQATTRGKAASTVVCRMTDGKISVSCERTLNATNLIALLTQTAAAVRKAAKEGLDLPTIERVLADRAKLPSSRAT
jgi:ParB/RepB/Spo0J family partition protein